MEKLLYFRERDPFLVVRRLHRITKIQPKGQQVPASNDECDNVKLTSPSGTVSLSPCVLNFMLDRCHGRTDGETVPLVVTVKEHLTRCT